MSAAHATSNIGAFEVFDSGLRSTAQFIRDPVRGDSHRAFLPFLFGQGTLAARRWRSWRQAQPDPSYHVRLSALTLIRDRSGRVGS